MTATKRLAKIKTRAEAATEGPWGWGQGDLCHLGGFVIGPPIHYEAVWANRASDAKFIAHARTDVPALVAALEAVLKVNTGDNRTLYGVDFEAGMAKALWLVHQAINGALGEDQS